MVKNYTCLFSGENEDDPNTFSAYWRYSFLKKTSKKHQYLKSFLMNIYN